MKALPSDKSAKQNGKSAGGGQHGNGRDFAPGHDPRRGHGPAKGHGGRPRNVFLERCRALAKAGVPEEILAEIKAEVRDKLLLEHPTVWLQVMALRLRAWIEVADRGFNRPSVQIAEDEGESRFIEGVPILDIAEWRKVFGAKNQ